MKAAATAFHPNDVETVARTCPGRLGRDSDSDPIRDVSPPPPLALSGLRAVAVCRRCFALSVA